MTTPATATTPTAVELAEAAFDALLEDPANAAALEGFMADTSTVPLTESEEAEFAAFNAMLA